MTETVTAFTRVIDQAGFAADTAADITARGRFNAFYATEQAAAESAPEGSKAAAVYFDVPPGCGYAAINPSTLHLLARGDRLDEVLDAARAGSNGVQAFITQHTPSGTVLSPLADYAISVADTTAQKAA